MTEAEKIAALEELFEVEPGTIVATMNLSDLSWDSMAQLGLIALMRSEFEKKLEPAQLKEFKTVSDILTVMND